MTDPDESKTPPTEPDDDDDMPQIDLSNPRWKFIRRWFRRGLRISIASLREAFGKTPLDIARAAGMTQADVARIEARGDVKISVLKRYAEALGGKAEIAIRIGDRQYLLDL